jgi:hypothetical protein
MANLQRASLVRPLQPQILSEIASRIRTLKSRRRLNNPSSHQGNIREVSNGRGAWIETGHVQEGTRTMLIGLSS